MSENDFQILERKIDYLRVEVSNIKTMLDGMLAGKSMCVVPLSGSDHDSVPIMFGVNALLDIIRCINKNHMIEAIKTVRYYNPSIGLKQAKDIVESLRATMTVEAAR